MDEDIYFSQTISTYMILWLEYINLHCIYLKQIKYIGNISSSRDKILYTDYPIQTFIFEFLLLFYRLQTSTEQLI